MSKYNPFSGGKVARLEAQLELLQTELDSIKKVPKRHGVLDHGYVELHDWMGDDLRIVNMARQSFGQESTEMGEDEKGLINFLMRERHGTPFEGPVYTFNVKCPLFVMREWIRHRIASYNEYSGRYSIMLEDFYVPELREIRTQEGKPGNYTFAPTAVHLQQSGQHVIRVNSEKSWEQYEVLIEQGTAKEVARMVLPVNFYTQFTWVVNLRSLFNFISLRSNENAMWEIRQFSRQIEHLVKPIVPVAYETFVRNGRVAP
jgi:thymidylate synthase (FAD)